MFYLQRRKKDYQTIGAGDCPRGGDVPFAALLSGRGQGRAVHAAGLPERQKGAQAAGTRAVRRGGKGPALP